MAPAFLPVCRIGCTDRNVCVTLQSVSHWLATGAIGNRLANETGGGTLGAVISVRTMTPADVPLADELRRLAGWNQSRRDWLGYLEFDPQGCFVAEVAGVPQGTVTTINYEGRVGWIGMVLVHPDQRRRGVGTALLQRAISWLKEQRVVAIKLDATPMGRSVYLPLGFCDEYVVTRYVGKAQTSTGETAAGISALRSADLSEVNELDASWFGVARRRVLASLSARNPEYGFVARHNRRVVGYVIARAGAERLQIGPWGAETPAIAESLLQAFLHRAHGREVLLDVPGPNKAGPSLLNRHGFSIQRGYTRMFLGENLCPGQPEKVFGTSAAEKG